MRKIRQAADRKPGQSQRFGQIITRRQFVHDGRHRTYTLLHTDPVQEGAPLILALHGSFENAQSFHRFTRGAFDTLARDGRAVLAYPDAVREWNGARTAAILYPSAKSVDDVGFLGALIDEIAARQPIDPARVYAIGYSLGGQMTIRLLHDAPELLAGAALIAVNQPAPGNLTVATTEPPRRPVPVLTIHGTADPLAPYTGGVISLRGLFPKGEHLSAADTAAYFARRNGITTAPTDSRLDTTGKPVHRTDYAGAAPVAFYTVDGGGHHIPGASTGNRLTFGAPAPHFDATAAISGFFGLTG
ncbi:alpha/beta hydrolase family esterase [Nocardia sp. NPDC088792]|uniref:alpha/beta hydrolase family esterase n=1 Tax=Nocardia sp. NPDC088792 TaxID=3364332 RepID=UPI00382115E9